MSFAINTTIKIPKILDRKQLVPIQSKPKLNDCLVFLKGDPSPAARSMDGGMWDRIWDIDIDSGSGSDSDSSSDSHHHKHHHHKRHHRNHHRQSSSSSSESHECESETKNRLLYIIRGN